MEHKRVSAIGSLVLRRKVGHLNVNGVVSVLDS
jgi:hypothetical protein